MIKAFIFDLGGVLVFHDQRGFVRAIAKRYGIDAKRFRAVELRERLKHDAGAIPTATYLRNIGREFGVRFEREQYYRWFFSKFTQTNTPLLALIRKLRPQYLIFLLSNSSPPAYRHVRASGMAKLFKRMLFSYRVKRKKPDPAFFRAVLRGTGITFAEYVFIDDRADITAAAKRLGMHTVTYTTVPATRRALAGMGIALGSKRR